MTGYTSPEKENSMDDTTRAQFLGTLVTSQDNSRSLRAGLLSLIPSITFGGTALTLFAAQTNQILQNLTFPLGIGGIVVVSGLFIIALDSTMRSERLSEMIRDLAKELGKPFPATSSNPVINTRTAIGILYSITVSGWICLALWFVTPGYAPLISLVALFIASIVTIPLAHKA
jgi:hypothetical protein